MNEWGVKKWPLSDKKINFNKRVWRMTDVKWNWKVKHNYEMQSHEAISNGKIKGEMRVRNDMTR